MIRMKYVFLAALYDFAVRVAPEEHGSATRMSGVELVESLNKYARPYAVMRHLKSAHLERLLKTFRLSFGERTPLADIQEGTIMWAWDLLSDKTLDGDFDLAVMQVLAEYRSICP